jgi:glycosyltransferase involved in cell wall biosynthesis
MQFDQVISFDKKKFFLFFMIFLFLFKTKNSYFDNKQLKVINANQINSNATSLKINETQNSLKLFNNYFNICNKLIKFNNNKNIIRDKSPFISVCIPVYNTEKYIERAVLSIINQSFQNFEIIIVNDFSSDNTLNIIKRLQKEDDRIRLINHYKNSGVYNSRIEAALNANGKYILFLDPDDIILNQYLFDYLYNYSTYYNLDIIEFLVYRKKEWQNYIYYPQNPILNHNHNFNNSIIYQPELSDIIFFAPNTKKYNDIICRTIWNKIYRRELLLKTIDYIGEEYYYNRNLIIADDTILNIMNFHFAKNYSNIKIGGYLYNEKAASMSRGFINKNHRIKQDISFYLYFKLLYKYIKDFDKDRNFMYNEINTNQMRIIEFKKLNISDYIGKVKLLLYQIKNDDKSSELLKNLIHKLLLDLN